MSTPTIGLRKFKELNQSRVTPELKLISKLACALQEARQNILNGKSAWAVAEIDYTLECVIPDAFFEMNNLNNPNKNL